jgi:hypothetical protein
MPLITPTIWVDDGQLILLIDASDPSGVVYFARAQSGSYTVAGMTQAIWQIWIVDAVGNKLFANGKAGFVNMYNSSAGYEYT